MKGYISDTRNKCISKHIKYTSIIQYMYTSIIQYMYTYIKLYTSSEFKKDTKKISNTDTGILYSCTRYYEVQITLA